MAVLYHNRPYVSRLINGKDVVGQHKVSFIGKKDELTFVHNAFDRSVFADGAIHCARWLLNKPAGFYSMGDVVKDVG